MVYRNIPVQHQKLGVSLYWNIFVWRRIDSMSFRSVNSVILSLITFAFLVSVSTAQETTSTTNEEVTELASASNEQTTVIQLTDPDIAAADDEEPDCE